MTSPAHPPGDRRALRRPVTAMLSLLVMCGALLAGMVMPVPYVIERPGPAIDVLGEYEGEKILDISGEQTYPTDGELMMTTVSVDGGPGYRVVPAQVLAGWASRDSSVAPRELLFPPGQTQDETSLLNMIQMSSSQQDAVAAALDELEIPYTRTIVVAGVQNDAPAEGTLEAGDVVLAL
ncbi:MAG: hypothetical protein Q4G40_12330, partial [Brachybacterium sp.]|nr:hypothetical protein [Brachybacterium sp.]